MERQSIKKLLYAGHRYKHESTDQKPVTAEG